MNADTLARLTREAEAPEGIAVRVSGPEMKRLLEERAGLLECVELLRFEVLAGPSIVRGEVLDLVVAAVKRAGEP